MTHVEDLALVRLVIAGDRAAGERLAKRLQCIGRILQARSRALCGGMQPDDLLDIAQDVLAKVFAKLPLYHGLAAIESWVFAFCEGELRNALRRTRRGPLTTSAIAEGALPEPTEPPAPAVHDGLLGCLEKLATLEQQLVRWKHYEDLRLEDIARRANQKLNTVKSRYYRALLQLRQCLERRKESA